MFQLLIHQWEDHYTASTTNSTDDKSVRRDHCLANIYFQLGLLLQLALPIAGNKVERKPFFFQLFLRTNVSVGLPTLSETSIFGLDCCFNLVCQLRETKLRETCHVSTLDLPVGRPCNVSFSLHIMTTQLNTCSLS